MFLRDDRKRLLIKVAHELGGLLFLSGFLVHRLGLRDWQPLAMRIGIRKRTLEAFATKNHNEAVPFAGTDNHVDAADLFNAFGEQRAEVFCNFSFDAPGTAVDDDAFLVERAKVRAGGDVAGLQLKAQAEGFDDTAADLEFERIVAEQSEMA